MEFKKNKGLFKLYRRGQNNNTYNKDLKEPASLAVSTFNKKSDKTARSSVSLLSNILKTALYFFTAPDTIRN